LGEPTSMAKKEGKLWGARKRQAFDRLEVTDERHAGPTRGLIKGEGEKSSHTNGK